jgi:hypothetical protein
MTDPDFERARAFFGAWFTVVTVLLLLVLWRIW